MTLKDVIQQMLCERGVQDATGVEVTFPGGVKMTIHSDNHPALDQEVADAPASQPTVRPVQSAQGGCK